MRTELIEGKFVNLRIAEVDDAEFTLSARQNQEKNKYIPQINISLEQQKNWIEKQIQSDDCYFFVVERKNGELIGTFSLYDINGDKAESGRLVMLGNQMESLETGVLFFNFGFGSARMKEIRAEIDKENNAAVGFSSRLGGDLIGEHIDGKTNRLMVDFVETPDGFNRVLPKLTSIIERFAKR